MPRPHMSGPCHRVVVPRHQRGVSLLEVMIAVLVLALGMLGMAGLQARVLKANISSLQRSQAIMLNNFILDAMRADRVEALAGHYDMAKTCSPPSGAGTLRGNNIAKWFAAMQDDKVLSSDTATTCGYISCTGGNGQCTVRIYWDDTRAGGSDSQMVETRTSL